MILTWHEDAQEEYVSAAVYYERRVEGLGERFIGQVEASIARMMSAPLRQRCFSNDFRKLRVAHFPYAVVYRVTRDELQIVAVAHAKRQPGYWRQRT